MRVLYLNPREVELGGAERSLIDLVSALDRSRVEPVAACVAEGPLAAAFREAGVKVVMNPWPAFALRIGRGSIAAMLLAPLAALALVPHVLRMARIVRRERVDLIHTNGLKAHLTAAPVRFLTRRPLIWHVRDVLRPGMTRTFFNLTARAAASRVIANSRTVAATFAGMPISRLVVVYNGIDTKKYAPSPAPPALRASLGIGPGDFVVGAIGALAPLKGHLHLIRAAPKILERAPEAKIVIVGEEVYLTVGHRGHRAVLEAEARRLGVSGRVVFAGYHRDAAAVMNCFDVLVHASVYPESFGRVLVESMACGVPVVATALGGPVEIIDSEDQGILIPPADPDAIAAAVLRIRDDAALRRTMSTAGRARVVDAFSIERYAREVGEVYRTLAG